MTQQARFLTKKFDAIAVVSIDGEVDISNVEELRLCLEAVADERGPGLIVDLTKAAYFDSATIALLADFTTNASAHRQRVAIVAPASGFASRILQIAGLPKLLPVFQTVEAAVSSLQQPAGF